MLDKIREALALLDPSDDNHWTAQGLPAMDTVCDLVGERVTRVQVSEAAPGFERPRDDAPAEGQGEPNALPELAGDVTISAEAPIVLDAKEPAPPAEASAPEPVDEREAAEAEAKARVAEIRARQGEARDAIARAQAFVGECDTEIARINTELEKRFPPLSQAEQYKRIVARSREDRRKRVEAERLALRVLHRGGKSPLDRAMASRRGFGLQRPDYFPGEGK